MTGPGGPKAGRGAPAGFGPAALAVVTGLAAGLVFALVNHAADRSAAERATLAPVSAAELIDSVASARPASLAGTVRLDERLGLLAPGRGEVVARLWSDGEGRRRIAVPEPDGERTIVDDGVAVWSWDSATRSVTRVESGRPADSALDPFAGAELVGNPAATASTILRMVAPESTARLDPPATVAGRPTYQLALTPMPTERTLLREIRLAVDGQTRLPLELSVFTNGSAEPALRIGFSSVRFGPQDPEVFRFDPAPGVRVRERPDAPDRPASAPATFGRGWDTVMVRRLPARARDAGPASVPPDASPDSSDDRAGTRLASDLGSELGSGPLATPIPTPISGPWGHGELVTTPIGSAVLTSDGRLVTGAVPAQVLTEALLP